MNFVFMFFVALFAIFMQPIFSSESDVKVITLEESIQLAKKNNISVKTAENTLNNLKTKKDYSWNSISPTAQINSSYTGDFENETTSFGVSGSVNLSLKTNLISNIQGAKLNYEKGQITYEQAVRAVELNVCKSFYNILFQKENIVLQKRNLATSREQYLNNQEKFRNGKISELDYLTSRVNYESKKPTVESAEITLENNLSLFKQILGINQNEKIELKGSLDDILKVKPVSFEELPAARKPSPEIRSAQCDVEIQKNALLDSRFSAYAPSISGGYTYGKSWNVTEESEQTTNSLNVGVVIPLDGYMPWTTKAVAIENNKTAVKNAELNLENAKTDVAVKTENYIRQINLAISQIESLKATEELAQQTYKMNLTAYNYGKTDLLSLQNASDSVLSAGVSIKSQAYTLVCALLDLENLLGIEFGTLQIVKE